MALLSSKETISQHDLASFGMLEQCIIMLQLGSGKKSRIADIGIIICEYRSE